VELERLMLEKREQERQDQVEKASAEKVRLARVLLERMEARRRSVAIAAASHSPATHNEPGAGDGPRDLATPALPVLDPARATGPTARPVFRAPQAPSPAPLSAASPTLPVRGGAGMGFIGGNNGEVVGPGSVATSPMAWRQ
jgi:hypothetical protein